MKWPFRRNQNIDGVPQEIQDYYQSERREKAGIAWLLALGTLLTTIALAILLFFGGRWVYRKVANRNNGNTSQVTQQPTETTAPANEPDTQSGNGQEGANTGTSSTSTNTPSATNTPTAQNPGGQSQTRGATSDLPNTGPGDVLAVFAITTAIGTATHYAVTSRKTEEA